MAKIELEVSIYPTVWAVVLENSGLPNFEVTERICATETLAQSRAYVLSAETGQSWKAMKVSVWNCPD